MKKKQTNMLTKSLSMFCSFIFTFYWLLPIRSIKIILLLCYPYAVFPRFRPVDSRESDKFSIHIRLRGHFNGNKSHLCEQGAGKQLDVPFPDVFAFGIFQFTVHTCHRYIIIITRRSHTIFREFRHRRRR